MISAATFFFATCAGLLMVFVGAILASTDDRLNVCRPVGGALLAVGGVIVGFAAGLCAVGGIA